MSADSAWDRLVGERWPAAPASAQGGHVRASAVFLFVARGIGCCWVKTKTLSFQTT